MSAIRDRMLKREAARRAEREHLQRARPMADETVTPPTSCPVCGAAGHSGGKTWARYECGGSTFGDGRCPRAVEIAIALRRRVAALEAERDRLAAENAGLVKANALLMKGMESQCTLMDGLKQENRRLTEARP